VSSSEKQKESVIRAELKRCASIERRWNRNEVSRESPDKEVNRRPISLNDTRCHFKMLSKADMSQLNLPHGTDNI